MDDDAPLPDLAALDAAALVKLYNSKQPDDPDVDRIANEMGERGIEF